MNRFGKTKMVFIIMLFAAALPVTTWAGGLYLYEVGNAEVGLASAGYAARAQDASTVFTNPAGMTRLDRPQIQLGIEPLYSNVKFSPDANTSASNTTRFDGTEADDGDASGWIPAGSSFYVHPVSKDLRLGIGILGFFGSALKYDDDWVGRYYLTEAKMQGLTVMPAVAYRVNKWLSVGAGLNAMYAILEQKAAVNNRPLGVLVDIPDGELTLDDKEWGFGGKFGILVEPAKGTRVGLTYLTETKLDFETKPEFEGLGSGLETALNSQGLLDIKLDLSVKAPQAVMLSGYHELNDRLAVMGNVGWEDWSEFGKVDVTVKVRETTDLTVDRKYEDTWHAAGGVQYKVSAPLLVSFGIAYDSSMVKDEDRTPDLPAGETWRIGLGENYKVNDKIDIGVAYELAWSGDLPMDVERGPLAGRVSGEYTNVATHVINTAMNWRF